MLQQVVESYLHPFAASQNFSGAVLLARQGKIEALAAGGMANYELDVPNRPDTVFHLASVSKPFTALAVLLVEEQGWVSLDDPIQRHVRGIPRGDQITLAHLLTNTSGLPDINGAPFYDRISRFPQTSTRLAGLIGDWLAGTDDTQEPGRYLYSNTNYNLLAYILERVTGWDYSDLLRDAIFAPLGMDATGHDGDAGKLIPSRAAGYTPSGIDGVENAPYLDWSSKTGNGSLYSTVEDLYRFHQALTDGALLRKRRLSDLVRSSEGYSFGWFSRDGGRSMLATGRSPGFTASFERFEEEDACVIVLSNSYSTVTQSPIARDLAAILSGREPSGQRSIQPVELPPAALDRFVGTYNGGPEFFRPGTTLTVERGPAGLLMRWSADLAVPLAPLGESLFMDRMFWARVRFETNRAGRVSYLIWSYDGRDYPAERT